MLVLCALLPLSHRVPAILHYVHAQPSQSGSLDRPSKRPLELDGLASQTISSGWTLRNLPRELV